MSEYILEGKNLSKHYESKKGLLKALNGVDFAIKKGETIGIVGESGCGKSTLLKSLTRLEKPTSGKIFLNGNDVSEQKGKQLRLSRKYIQMVFQDPTSAFSPRLKVRDSITEPLNNFYKFNKTQIDTKVSELLELVELPKEFASRYCHEMSIGQRQRLGIARALSVDPDILVCDESTSALDVSIQANIMKLLSNIQKKRNLSIIFVCHDIALVASISHKIMIMYLGTVVEIIKTDDMLNNVLHPYSKSLISSIFNISMDFTKEINSIEGEVPNPINLPLGCSFSTRCNNCMEVCKTTKPKLISIGDSEHKVACHLYN